MLKVIIDSSNVEYVEKYLIKNANAVYIDTDLYIEDRFLVTIYEIREMLEDISDEDYIEVDYINMEMKVRLR